MLHRIGPPAPGGLGSSRCGLDGDFGLARANCRDCLVAVKTLAPGVVTELADFPQLFAACFFRLHLGVLNAAPLAVDRKTKTKHPARIREQDPLRWRVGRTPAGHLPDTITCLVFNLKNRNILVKAAARSMSKPGGLAPVLAVAGMPLGYRYHRRGVGRGAFSAAQWRGRGLSKRSFKTQARGRKPCDLLREPAWRNVRTGACRPAQWTTAFVRCSNDRALGPRQHFLQIRDCPPCGFGQCRHNFVLSFCAPGAPDCWTAGRLAEKWDKARARLLMAGSIGR